MTNHSLDILIPVITAFLGAITAYLFSRRKNTDDFSATLFAEYRHIAQELAEILTDLHLQSLMPQEFSVKECKEIDNELGVFLYKYYLVLPQQVIEEINCLHECLLCKGNRLFIIKQKNGVPIVQPRNNDEVQQLIEDVAIVTTGKTFADLYQRYKKLPNSIYLKCQARHVLTVMHDCWNLSNIHEWKKRLPKETIAQRKRRLQKRRKYPLWFRAE